MNQDSILLDSQPVVVARSRPLCVMVLGASGFIGRHVVRALLADGMTVVGVRRPPGADPALPAEPAATDLMTWLHLRLHTLLHPDAWRLHLHGIDVVINCVGILRQRVGERYEDVHHGMPRALAQACAEAGVRLIHTSALGVHEGARSRFLSSKLRGEQATDLGEAYAVLAQMPTLACQREANRGGERLS